MSDNKVRNYKSKLDENAWEIKAGYYKRMHEKVKKNKKQERGCWQ